LRQYRRSQTKTKKLPAAKRPRLEATTWIPTLAEDAADEDIFVDAQTYRYMADDTLTASPDDTVAVAPADTVTVVAAYLPSTGASSRAHRRKWAPEDDAKLTEAVTELGTSDWIQVAVMVPDRMNIQCRQRRTTSLDPTNINRGQWTVKEDAKLMNKRVDEMTARGGRWTTAEDIKLKDAVQKHNGKNWAANAALATGRTRRQCYYRWHYFLQHSKSDETTTRVGKWTTDEDSSLIDAVERHNGKNWVGIASLVPVPGRTIKQCYSRWHDALRFKSNETITRKVKWTKEEVSMLKEAVDNHNGEDWAAISELVPCRTSIQCKKDGTMSCSRRATIRQHLRVNGQKKKTAS
jgi:hypothetical protein